MIISCKLLSLHLDKCIITLYHFSTTKISPERRLGGKGKGTWGQLAASPSGAAHDLTTPHHGTDRGVNRLVPLLREGRERQCTAVSHLTRQTAMYIL